MPLSNRISCTTRRSFREKMSTDHPSWNAISSGEMKMDFFKSVPISTLRGSGAGSRGASRLNVVSAHRRLTPEPMDGIRCCCFLRVAVLLKGRLGE